ncbi:hypothetical protein QCD85_12685 [Paenibacillus sp. PsM32]|uniref:Uncharacterized protein n=1 Tax=Paenibacillus kyungheensis TaxID=1452732 RepID=A0AAX3LZ31_9BACL|nr:MULTISPECIES: hypothetical protein [Paenibacillus]MDN4618962.1 hypothetical protein [Paenibacillus sp. PsM32]MDQ1235122.1 hypothetical protein [Paenibacillus sp. SORGH_AS_0306]MDR6112169.1 hypothetical protein [Paenibacillus sp. SORGH_AS_0338]WCT54689.1 hypothetical protein PQ456_15985 [Paenibacillus kyungheensis]WDF52168.1 hypothetical protein PQ460_07070 [Paenibacillus sp. KACC 21273]
MYNINILAFLKDTSVACELRLFCERFSSAEHALWEKGMRLFHQYQGNQHANLTLTVSHGLKHMDETYDIYIVNLREYTEEELDLLYIAKHCELLLLSYGEPEDAVRFAALQRRTPHLWCARLPLVTFELECLMQAILYRLEQRKGEKSS